MLEKTTPLSDRQRARAADFHKLPRIVSCEIARGSGFALGDIHDIAVGAFMRIAATFSPDKYPRGEAGFPFYAYHWMKKAVRAELARAAARERPALFSEISGSAVRALTADDANRRVGLRRDAKMPWKQAQAMKKEMFREMYLSGVTYPGMERRLNVTGPTLFRWRKQLGLPLRRGA